jgi:hypothetical protein
LSVCVIRNALKELAVVVTAGEITPDAARL